MMGLQDIRNLSLEELVQYVRSVDENPYRATQVFEWLYKRGAGRFEAMENLPLGLRERLKKNWALSNPVVVSQAVSHDGTIKFLFELNDKERVETVLIPAASRKTVCVSTQAGCKFGCRFCASGIGGWRRDLSCAEILGQILHVKNITPGGLLSHIVFMGTGEPLDNYDNLLKVIRILNAPQGLHIAARRITISTCGLIPKIKQLAQEGLQLELAISLHGSNQETRTVLMPVNKKYPLDDLVRACRDYIRATKRQITFEYILIKDLTCTPRAAAELGQLLKGMLCKVNLIPYNKVEEFLYEPPSRRDIMTFQERLKALGVHATVRMPRGRDVAAACGQLRHSASF